VVRNRDTGADVVTADIAAAKTFLLGHGVRPTWWIEWDGSSRCPAHLASHR
jgi:hypothetical protein